jgi:hypothetical protein
MSVPDNTYFSLINEVTYGDNIVFKNDKIYIFVKL